MVLHLPLLTGTEERRRDSQIIFAGSDKMSVRLQVRPCYPVRRRQIDAKKETNKMNCWRTQECQR